MQTDWQGDAAQGGDADGNYNQSFEVDEEHDTSMTLEKKNFNFDEVDSPAPDVIPLTQFLTNPPPPETVDNKDNEEVDVWDESWVRVRTVDEQKNKRVTTGFGVYSIAEAWE